MTSLKFELLDNLLTPEDFIRLRVSAGFATTPREQAAKAIRNSLLCVTAVCDGNTVGMGRLVGDGVMYWYLQEIIVHPDYQSRGIGRSIVRHLLEYVRRTALPGTRVTVGLMAAAGKESFYEQLGFFRRPNDRCGAGMIQWLDIEPTACDNSTKEEHNGTN